MLIRGIESGSKSLLSANDDSDDVDTERGERSLCKQLPFFPRLILNDVAQTREGEGKERKKKDDIQQREGKEKTNNIPESNREKEGNKQHLFS